MVAGWQKVKKEEDDEDYAKKVLQNQSIGGVAVAGGEFYWKLYNLEATRLLLLVVFAEQDDSD